MQSKLDIAFRAVQPLVSKFSAHESTYNSAEFGEASLRQEFVDELLKALGWDVAGKQHSNPFEREVRVEKNVAVGSAKKRADYALFVKPNFRDVRLYVEAKRSTTQLATQDSYFQTARYGWSSNTPLAVLTNFRELHILDCRYRPDIDSVLESAKTEYRYNYRDFSDAKKFAEIYWLISREAVGEGSLEKRAIELPKKRGKAVQRGLFKRDYQSIDEAFLEDLDEMRKELARSLKNRNHALDGETLTEVTQRVLDRLVFLRFLEDKLIETQERVSLFGKKAGVWLDFLAASRRLDGRYNGVVFKPHRLIDDRRELDVDERVFGAVCEKLSHVNSPYDFNAIPIHILGSIYERFLGKIIKTTDKRATLEVKPEVRKAGGVYYTPEYVVRVIVDQTVGPLLEGKNPKEISVMRFADIACGSGSFLLNLFDCLLRYHAGWYNSQNDKERAKFEKTGECIRHDDGLLHLSLTKRREILINNIFGVDIDAQATEVAQLSLYLKLLEEETTASARNYQMEMGAALLPSLSKNIACGNSLIELDVLESEEDELFEINRDEERKLNPMDFDLEFPDILKKRGGFDAVVGNPPWGAAFTNIAKQYLKRRYGAVHVRTPESFNYFVFRMLALVKADGAVGAILPSSFLTQHEFWRTREVLAKGEMVKSILNLGDGVFHKVTAPCCIVVANKNGASGSTSYVDLRAIPRAELPQKIIDPTLVLTIRKLGLNTVEFTFNAGKSDSIFKKMAKLPTLKDIAQEVATGISSGLDVAYVFTDEEMHKLQIEKDLSKKLVVGGEINRYRLAPKSTKRILYLTSDVEINKFPHTLDVLLPHKPKLKLRREAASGKIPWFCLNWPRRKKLFEEKKILIRQTASKIMAVLDEDGWYCLKSGLIVQLPAHTDIDYRYLLALMNSRLLGFYYNELVGEQGRVFPEVKPVQLFKLPIKVPDSKKPSEMKSAERLIKLVDQIVLATTELADAKTDRDQNFFANKCSQIDRQIDMIVYELYGIDSVEKSLIEGERQPIANN